MRLGLFQGEAAGKSLLVEFIPFERSAKRDPRVKEYFILFEEKK
jgi:hypothetical protein